jgi:manganese/zinc/iron transport system permease protein
MSEFFTYNTLLVLAGTGLLGTASGLIGSLAMLRRQALVGDVFAHAAFPGLCLAFIIVGERALPALLLGGFLSGVLGLIFVSIITRYSRIKQDAALGLVLSTFFGLGIVLSSIIQRMTTGTKSGIDSYIFGKTAGIIAQDVYLIGFSALVCLVAILLLYKEFQVITFDTDFATVQGWPVRRLDLAIIGLIGLIVVMGLPAVGVVMMAALLILPGITARFWTERFSTLLWLGALLGLIIGAAGTLLSAQYANLKAGPTIVLVGAALFVISAIIAPRRGLIARWRQVNVIDTRHLELEATP